MAKQARMRPSWKKDGPRKRLESLKRTNRLWNKLEKERSLAGLDVEFEPWYKNVFCGRAFLVSRKKKSRKVRKQLKELAAYKYETNSERMIEDIVNNQGCDGPSLEHKPLIGDFKLHHAVICATERRPIKWTEGLPQDARYAIWDFEKKCRDEGKKTSRQKFENGGPLADINLKILDVVKNSNVPYLCYSTETQTFAISCCDKEIRAKCLKLWKEYEANQEVKEPI